MKNKCTSHSSNKAKSGTMKETGCNRFFLDFSLFLSLHQGKERKSIEFEKLCNASARQEALMSSSNFGCQSFATYNDMFAFSLIIKLLRFLIYFAGFSESRCLDLAFCIFLVIDSLLLFACPKSNQKRPPKTKQPPALGWASCFR